MEVKSLVPYPQALSKLASEMVSKKTVRVGGLWEFVKDVWSQGYPRPELFNSWHVGVICEDVERALQEGKYYAAVLPRYHLKSTVLGYAVTVWSFLKSAKSRFGSSGMYLSYSDGMSTYHISEIKKAIRRNEQLKEWLQDRVPEADFSFRYLIDGTQVDLHHGGLFSFKRGTHVNRVLIADDLLRDPDNPLNLTQLMKAEEHFMTESLYIPVEKAFVVVLGTPMAPNDLLTKLRDDERFIYRFMPALDPVPGRRVLCPEIRSEAALLAEQRSRPRSFASEMMLQPYLSTSTYISDEEIRLCEKAGLTSLDPYKKHNFGSEVTVAGFDVGKKRHPSHLVVYTSKNGILTQVHQAFLDGWPYVRQIKYLNDAAESFGIDWGNIDNTRGELEERGLHPAWKFVTFTVKQKRTMAQIFEEFVHNKKLEMIPDERQRSQITCVDSDLNAPETPLGHGDSFYSNALAMLAYRDSTAGRTQTLGDVGSFAATMTRPSLTSTSSSPYNGRDPTSTVSCPKCGQTVGWIPERSLCLICSFEVSS